MFHLRAIMKARWSTQETVNNSNALEQTAALILLKCLVKMFALVTSSLS